MDIPGGIIVETLLGYLSSTYADIAMPFTGLSQDIHPLRLGLSAIIEGREGPQDIQAIHQEKTQIGRTVFSHSPPLRSIRPLSILEQRAGADRPRYRRFAWARTYSSVPLGHPRHR